MYVRSSYYHVMTKYTDDDIAIIFTLSLNVAPSLGTNKIKKKKVFMSNYSKNKYLILIVFENSIVKNNSIFLYENIKK